MIRPTLASDVDGVVLGLMEGFSLWMEQRWGHTYHPMFRDETDQMMLPVQDVVFHSQMGKSPKLQDLRKHLDRYYQEDERHTSIGKAFVEFMQLPTVYEDWVPLLPGAQEAFARISERCDPVFITATMKDAPSSYASKFRVLQKHFKGVPVASIPSELKHHYRATFAVDDRWDICARYNHSGTSAFCLRQPWSEAPEGAYTYTWPGIANAICGGFTSEF